MDSPTAQGSRPRAYSSNKCPVHHQRSKHIDIKYHWIRDMVSSATVKLIDMHTDDDQRADFLTKTLRGATRARSDASFVR
jgi:hypothetical protein